MQRWSRVHFRSPGLADVILRHVNGWMIGWAEQDCICGFLKLAAVPYNFRRPVGWT